MELQHLRYFCAIVKEGSITRAAEKNNISQPALSQTISKLESELGVALFERLPRGIQLTSQGSRFLEYANEALSREHDIRKELADMGNIPFGEIVIKCNAVSHLVAKLFLEFQKDYPKTELRFIQANTPDHKKYAPDLIITSELETASELNSVPLITEELQIAVPATHHLAHRKSIRLEEIANEKFLSIDGRELENIFKVYCSIAGFTLNSLVKCSNINILRGLLQSGIGITVMAYSWRMECNNSIVLLPIEYPICTRTIRLCWNKDRYMSNAAQLFKEYLINNFAKRLEEYF